MVPQPSTDTPYILIVEDDPDIREALVDVLAMEGISSATAGNGQQALDHLAARPHPALILLDYMMPVMDAVEFRRRQLALEPIAKIPVCLLSAANESTKLPAELAPAVVLRKPVAIDQLIEVAKRFTHRS